MFDVDIENDHRNKVFWNITTNKKVIIDDQMYNYLGYSGQRYHKRKYTLAKLLKRPGNEYIQYEEVADEQDERKKYYVLSGTDFDIILMQMRTPKVVELRHLFSILKNIMVKQCEYEKLYDRYQAAMLMSQNNILLSSVNELKSLVVTVKTTADEERKLAFEREYRAEQERQKAEDERQKAEDERQRAENERQLAFERERLAERRSNILSQQMQRNVSILNSVIAPRIAPLPIGKHKTRGLGLYKTSIKGEFYMMRRQQEGWREAERKLFARNMTWVWTWDNVPHAVDIGNLIKRHYRQYDWFTQGNFLRAKQLENLEKVDDEIVQIISNILTRENEATILANENINVQNATRIPM